MYFPLHVVDSFSPEIETIIENIEKKNIFDLKRTLYFYKNRIQNNTPFGEKSQNSVINKFIQDNINNRPNGYKKKDIYDLILLVCDIYNWKKFKQVYIPDYYLADAFLRQEKVSFFKEAIASLPSDYFYVDFKNLPNINIEGCFVSIDKINETDKNISYGINICPLEDKKDHIVYHCSSFALSFDKNSKDPIICDNYQTNIPQFILSHDLEYNTTVTKANNIDELKNAFAICMQLITYIGTVQYQKDHKCTKDTETYYKPLKNNEEPKNKYSEIYAEDIGYIFGNSFKLQIEQAKKQYNKIIDSESQISQISESRKSPIPHYVSAHISHYWCGKNNSILETRWIEPYFTGLNKNDEIEIPIAHDVDLF